MSVKSMTGFARAEGSLGVDAWHWEARSVNGRSLEIRLRLPAGLEALETRVREICARRLSRGNCNITLAWQRSVAATSVRLNEAVLADVAKAIEKAQAICPAAPPTLDGILALRGVLETVETEESEAAIEARNSKMLADLERTLDALVVARGREGERLAGVLNGLIDETERLTRALDEAPQRAPEHILARLKDAIARLQQATPELVPERLHQEAMLIATRIDVTEEIARLKSHIEEARVLLAAAEPVGRRLDFLTQELNREANTVCSKANDTALTRIGLDLKAVIDQLREQVQNIE
ncbi:MAG: YicC/YloC family endoribonuclease [Hyphomicrobiaceae bacterium]